MSHRIFHPENIVNGMIFGGSSHHHRHHHHLEKREDGGSILLQKGWGGVGSAFNQNELKGNGLTEKLKKLHLKTSGEGIKIKRKKIALNI